MNILVVTNIYTPFAGGVPRSIAAFRDEYLKRGHRVLVVAPRSASQPSEEEGVVRFPAISNVYRDRYSLPWPIPGYLDRTVKDFSPDVIHSHHPFLLGNVAQRIAATWDVPLVYTHHTKYEHYLANETLRSQLIADFVSRLTAAYCEFCDAVIAPTKSIVSLLRNLGVERPIETIPTGVDFARFQNGSRQAIRRQYDIPEDAPVVGHLGRLEPEKNLGFLTEAVAAYLTRNPKAYFLLVGDGQRRKRCEEAFRNGDLASRFRATGTLEGKQLVDAYHAMDLFAFASHSETQGMVLTEAMASGVPVVAVQASGVDDILVDGRNGRLLARDDVGLFADAIDWFFRLPADKRTELSDEARKTAKACSMAQCAEKALTLYAKAVEAGRLDRTADGLVAHPLRLLRYEWRAWARLLSSFGNRRRPGPSVRPRKRREHVGARNR